jgi:hypothetical protein
MAPKIDPGADLREGRRLGEAESVNRAAERRYGSANTARAVLG